ncbi:hypothetical protein NIES4071_66260 [Calothrix sp. NIES-4071]|nr:hypothetical protein NIES4071_66260 [Calothrix sp. NIES-4071]BAZ60930.1 hypothetical protein NIES4105_66220 [Calothrix sp. NIES-4105]
MLLRLSIISAILGLASYWLGTTLNIDVASIPYLQILMNIAIILGLYINVLSIDTSLLKSCLGSVIKVICIGVPVKIILPGFVLALCCPKVAPIAYLCATVIAQIDPIAASKSLQTVQVSRKSETILRAWSSFDDPVTVLFAFYVFLPVIIFQDSNINQYLVKIATDILSCGLAYYSYKLYQDNRQVNLLRNSVKTTIEAICLVIVMIYSVISGSFLLPAFVGFFLRPFSPERLEPLISAIFYFSVVVIGLLCTNISLDWLSGGILAFSMFFVAQVLVAVLFLKDSMANKLKIMFGHQNGMTAILLTVAIEVSGDKTGDLLAVTLPAIILIALFYFSTNFLLDTKLLQRIQR